MGFGIWGKGRCFGVGEDVSVGGGEGRCQWQGGKVEEGLGEIWIKVVENVKLKIRTGLTAVYSVILFFVNSLLYDWK